MHLLVADDNEINLRVACAYLKALGISPEAIHTASNGREAAEMCQRLQFDLVFMDIQMPEVDGIQAAKEILSENGKPKPTIVALTANTSEEAEREYRAAGMKMVLHKPVNKSAFMDALKLAQVC
ncbi:response regulator [Aliikangiella sp. G2MR2-5]|uniref:response regulator n=1 Tax=Aliikangiella sp. G2MR2-5 TaxID=2788943 RepID=UPI0018AB6DFD|nr:response regulator [Aliikangiella sp. G2MR2-5]